MANVVRGLVHRESMPPFRRVFAENQSLHDAIKAELKQIRGGFFFEAGANDGLLFSCTAYLERYLGWRGLLVEAVPHKFVECVRNRPNSVVVHCALVDSNFDRQHVEIRYSNLMSVSPALSSINYLEHIEMGEEYLLGAERRLSGCEFLAPAKTLNDVLRSHDVSHIDFMVLDLEGAELGALKGLDVEACRVDRILIEVRDRQVITEFMEARGYGMKARFSDRDYLFVRR